MRHFKPIAIVLGIIVGLIVLSLVFSMGPSEPKNRKIAEGLLELHRQFDTTTNVPSLYRSLTNLPFHDGPVIIANGSVSCRHNVLGIKWAECYFVIQPHYKPQHGTNLSEWKLYHAWFWYPPGHGEKNLATQELITITNE